MRLQLYSVVSVAIGQGSYGSLDKRSKERIYDPLPADICIPNRFYCLIKTQHINLLEAYTWTVKWIEDVVVFATKAPPERESTLLQTGQ